MLDKLDKIIQNTPSVMIDLSNYMYVYSFLLGIYLSIYLYNTYKYAYIWDFHGYSLVKNPHVNTGDASSIPGLGRSLGEGNGNPLQYSCLENPMDLDWQAIQFMGLQSQTCLSN